MTQTTLLDLADFRRQARAGEAPAGMLFKLLSTTDPQITAGANSRTFKWELSNQKVDHDFDRIFVAGWDLQVYLSNPVLLWAHASWQPNIGVVNNVRVVGERLMGDVEFAPADVSSFADDIFRLVRGRFLRAGSVGFIAGVVEQAKEKDRPFGLNFVRGHKLVEFSITPVPANAGALVAARAAGISTASLRTWAEQILDGEVGSAAPRRAIEATHRLAAEPRGRVVRSASGDVMNECVDAINGSIVTCRETIRTMKSLLPTSPMPPPPPGADDYPPAPGPSVNPADNVDPPFDPGPLQIAIGHVSEAVARKVKAVGALRDAIAGTPADPDAENPIGGTRAARLAEAKRLKAEIARSAATWVCAAARDLPLDDAEDWDGAAAAASIFEHAADGDGFDSLVAKRGFLAFDSSAPELRKSYKEPFARADSGTLRAVKGGVRAAASRLPQADIGETARTEAKAVLDAYEKRFAPKAHTPLERVAEARRLRAGLERAAERRQEVAALLAELRA